jgi:hypothetical protein
MDFRNKFLKFSILFIAFYSCIYLILEKNNKILPYILWRRILTKKTQCIYFLTKKRDRIIMNHRL